MHQREEGEVSDEDEVYKPVARPVAPMYRTTKQTMMSSDDFSSDDSDDEWKQEKKRMRIAQAPKAAAVDPVVPQNGPKPKKRNNIWANVIQEDELSQVIGGVGLKKLTQDRSVESYDYSLSKSNRDKQFSDGDDSSGENGGARGSPESMGDVEDDPEKKDARKKRFNVDMDHSGGGGIVGIRQKRLLPDIKPEAEWSDETLAKVMAENLREQKAELIVRVVEVVGRETAMKLYEETKKIEYDGGMLWMNGSRRRTSGGVFLQILKFQSLVSKEDSQKIFDFNNEQSQIVKRKKRADKRKRKVKNQGSGDNKMTSAELPPPPEDPPQLVGVFTEDPGGTKCPGSTPVESAHNSDIEDNNFEIFSPESRSRANSSSIPIAIKEVVEKAALQIGKRDTLVTGLGGDDMEVA